MKHEIGITQPSYLVEDWPGKYDVFSWLEYIVTVPNPIFLVTTRKTNGAANANLHSWGFLVGERDHYSSLLAVLATGIVNTALALVIMGNLVGRVGSTRASFITYVIPVVALVLGVVFRSDRVAWIAVVGVALVITGAILASRRER